MRVFGGGGGGGRLGRLAVDSLFFRFSQWSERVRERRANARNKGGILAPSVTPRSRVSRAFRSTD